MFVLTQTVRAAEVDESVAESQSSWLLVGHEKRGRDCAVHRVLRSDVLRAASLYNTNMGRMPQSYS